MEHVIKRFNEEFAGFIEGKVGKHELEFKKIHDVSYVIGDHLDLMGRDLFHGGATHNDFLLFIHVRKPYIVSVYQWKNEPYHDMQEDIFTFTKETLSELLTEASFEGVLDIQFRKRRVFLTEHYLHRETFGEDASYYLGLANCFPGLHPLMSPEGTFQWVYGFASFYVQYSPRHLRAGHYRHLHRKAFRTKEDVRTFIEMLDNLNLEYEIMMNCLQEHVANRPGLEWGHKHLLEFGDFRDSLHFRGIGIGHGRLLFFLTENKGSVRGKERVFSTIEETKNFVMKRIDDFIE